MTRQSKINIIKRNCPDEKCKGDESDVLGVLVKDKESFTHYRCLTCKKPYFVPRKGNKKEQELTEKYIKSSSIKLK